MMEPTDAESGLRLAFLRDPDGNPIELLQRPR
jgi:catechol 2,3-dioxygenase-like lactoylglutathione lyase family enzyme